MIANQIIAWFEENGRELPWRGIDDAYKIWISEVILQQTRIAQGTAYYHRFIERFPDVQSLADAEQDEVLKYWEGLGYYSRARNLHHAAKQILTDYGGEFPQTWKELIKLKGLGDYSARAISSFAFGENVGVIDGNVFRVMSRVLNDFSPIDAPSTRTQFQITIDKWVKDRNAAAFNHGIMDIGSTICTPTQPACSVCPLTGECLAFQEETQLLLPRKQGKLTRKTKYFHFFLVLDEQHNFFIQQRPSTGIWGGLWEIPNQEIEEEAWQILPQNATFKQELKHVFTHFDMQIKVFSLSEKDFQVLDKAKKISADEVKDYAFPRAILKIFEENSF